MSRALLLLLLWTIQLTLVAAFVSSEWLQDQIDTERQSVLDYMGADIETRLRSSSDAHFHSMFVESGIIDRLHRYLIPDKAVPKHGTERLAPWFFEWLNDSLRTFWLVVYQGTYRLLVLGEWISKLGMLLLAACVDGLVERKIRKQNMGYANPVRYRAGIRTLGVLLIVPMLFLTVPICVTPLLGPVWVIALSGVLMLIAANAQHRI